MKAVFALLALALAAVLGWQWRDWPPSHPPPRTEDPATAQVQTSQPPQENPLDLLTPLGEKEEYAVVTERPLFLPDRRPPSEEPPPEDASPEPEQLADLDRLDLNAVMITPAASLAWVRDPSQKKLVRLEPGDDLLGWSVQEILSDRVLLQRQGETDTLILRDYKNMPPPKPPLRRQAARKPPRRGGTQPPAVPNATQPNRRQPGLNMPAPGRPVANRPSAPPRAGSRNPPRVNARNPQQQR